MARDLTPKQEKFCLKYIETGNASEAYRQAELEKVLYTKDIPNSYVYVLVDPINDEIFYIGKGKNDRCLHHERNARNILIGNVAKHNRIKDIILQDMVPEKHIMMNGLSDRDSVIIERTFINRIGLQRLTNAMHGNTTALERIKALVGHHTTILKLNIKYNKKVPLKSIEMFKTCIVELNEALKMAKVQARRSKCIRKI